MDPVTSFIRSWKLPVGPWGKSFMDFIVNYFQWLFDALKDGGRLAFGSGQRLRSALVVAQFALAVVVVSAAPLRPKTSGHMPTAETAAPAASR